ncbi:C6 zinc finger domain-containing protein [Arthroderma uncinatum]|uniref:C6 zinc finger domain-containing protein n=1 Tax=Arthroderma uncinatum TaxID=74035 RepID=UPI00144A59C1|nr:C6 zinc finger domain-containing protein [Arthroderma uncinatum]KAF3492072.1 C6 zinc finger domain-containing protein [Arthroderma uncinatum]
MSVVAPAPLPSGSRDIAADASPEQSPSSFTAVNGRDRSASLMNGQPDLRPSPARDDAASTSNNANNNNNTTTNNTASNGANMPHDKPASADGSRDTPVDQAEVASAPDTANTNPNTNTASSSGNNNSASSNKRKRSSIDSHHVELAPRSPAQLPADHPHPPTATNGNSEHHHQQHQQQQHQHQQQHQQPYTSVERPDEAKSNSSNVGWDYDSQSQMMNNSQRHSKQQHMDASDAQLAEALQREVQSETPSENASTMDMQGGNSSSHMQSQSPNSSQVAPKRKRVFSNRTKTGCMTCRRRKKKCDEQHPSCNNCIRGGFPCEGYSVRSTWQKPSQNKGPIPLQSKDRYPEPPNLYMQDMSPQRHDSRMGGPMLPDGSKTRPVSVDDNERAQAAYMTSPSGTVARVAWQKGSWQAANHHMMQDSAPKLEYRDAPVIADISRPEPPKSDYHHSHSNNNNNANNSTNNNNGNNTNNTNNNAHQKPGIPVFQSNMEPRPNHAPPPRVDTSSYPTQARLALSSMEPHVPFEGGNEKSEKEKMLSGEQYRPFDPELVRDREQCKAALWRFTNAGNPLYGISSAEKTRLLTQILQPSAIEPPPDAPPPSTSTPTGSLGPGAILESPFNCHYGYNINIGEDVLISENCFFADDCSINIGAHTWIGPNVTILSSMAIGSMQERKGSQSRYQGRPVVIAEDCWIGAGCTILPGVTLGRGAYIAPGEVVRSQILPYGFQGLKPNYP